MVKLNQTRVKWLVRQVVKKGKLPAEVASVYDISPRRVQQLVRYYRETGKMPMLSKGRRPKAPLSEEQRQLIHRTHLKHKVGARLLKTALDEDHPENRISKNKIHEYLTAVGYTKPDKKKQKQRKRCRYERQHSGSLGHMDTHDCKWKNYSNLTVPLDISSDKALILRNSFSQHVSEIQGN